MISSPSRNRSQRGSLAQIQEDLLTFPRMNDDESSRSVSLGHQSPHHTAKKSEPRSIGRRSGSGSLTTSEHNPPELHSPLHYSPVLKVRGTRRNQSLLGRRSRGTEHHCPASRSDLSSVSRSRSVSPSPPNVPRPRHISRGAETTPVTSPTRHSNKKVPPLSAYLEQQQDQLLTWNTMNTNANGEVFWAGSDFLESSQLSLSRRRETDGNNRAPWNKYTYVVGENDEERTLTTTASTYLRSDSQPSFMQQKIKYDQNNPHNPASSIQSLRSCPPALQQQPPSSVVVPSGNDSIRDLYSGNYHAGHEVSFDRGISMRSCPAALKNDPQSFTSRHDGNHDHDLDFHHGRVEYQLGEALWSHENSKRPSLSSSELRSIRATAIARIAEEKFFRTPEGPMVSSTVSSSTGFVDHQAERSNFMIECQPRVETVDRRMSDTVPGPQVTAPTGFGGRGADRGQECRLVEIGPGQFLKYFGWDETMDAYLQGRATQCTCTSCQTFLFCSDQCRVVRCPSCHAVTPVEDNSSASAAQRSMGIGLTLEEVLKRTQGS